MLIHTLKPVVLALTACAAISAFAALPATTTPVASTNTTTTNSGDPASSGVTAGRLVDNFAGSAGSRTDAQKLVEGVRSGKDVTIGDVTVSGSGKTTGYGNVNIALSLARAQAGEDAMPKDFLTALDQVMDMRASGMGWGQIAKDLGFNLGQVISASKTGHAEPKGKASTRSEHAPNANANSKSKGKGDGAAAVAAGQNHASNGHAGGTGPSGGNSGNGGGGGGGNGGGGGGGGGGGNK